MSHSSEILSTKRAWSMIWDRGWTRKMGGLESWRCSRSASKRSALISQVPLVAKVAVAWAVYYHLVIQFALSLTDIKRSLYWFKKVLYHWITRNNSWIKETMIQVKIRSLCHRSGASIIMIIVVVLDNRSTSATLLFKPHRLLSSIITIIGGPTEVEALRKSNLLEEAMKIFQLPALRRRFSTSLNVNTSSWWVS